MKNRFVGLRQAVLTGVSVAALGAVFGIASSASAALYVETDGSLDGGVSKDVNAIAGYQVTAVEGDIATSFSTQDAFYFSGLPTGVQTFVFDIQVAAGSVFGYYTENDTSVDFVNFFGPGSGSFVTSAMFNGTLAIYFEAEGQPASGTYSIGLAPSEVPIPGAAALMIPGLMALGAAKRRRRAKRR